MKFSFLFTFFSLLLLFSCKKDKQITPDVGYNYFPGEVGSWIIYDVDSTDYSIGKVGDTLRYKFQIKEVIESQFTDAEGRTALRIERYKRNYNDTISYDSLPWTLVDVWAANKTNTTFEKVEENVRFIKLVFPVKQSTSWNGNAQNTIEEWTYKYTDIDKKRTLGSFTFDSTTLVTQKNSETFIDKQYYVEIYAKNIGLVYKEITDIKSQKLPFTIPVINRIDSGVICKYTIISYGKIP